MALQITITDPTSELSLNNTYARIVSVCYDKESVIDFHLDVWTGQTARQNTKRPILRFSYSIPYNENYTSMSSLYTYLKTLPEFAGALDV